MRILVTGATGFIGRWLIPSLRGAGHDVCALVRSSTDTTALERLGVKVLRDNGVSDLQPALVSHGPVDGVIHLASLFLASHSSEDITPLLTSNVLFPARLMDAAVRSGIRWFVNTGTTWQHFEGRDYSPVNLYSATKQAFEDVARYYVEAQGLRFVTLALGDTYGPDDPRPKLLNLWCRIAQTGEPLDMSEGLQKIDLVYVTDVVRAFRMTVDQLASEVWSEGAMPTFSVSSDECLSLRELACLFEAAVGLRLPIRWGARPTRAREVLLPWRGRRVPGWAPDVSFQEGVGQVMRSAQKEKPRGD